MKLRTLAATALVALAAAAARADVLTLKDGQKVEGEIVRKTADELEVKIRYGSIVVRTKDVAKIEKRLTPEQELEERKQLLGDKDANGRVELARFCLERDLPAATAAALAADAWRLERGNEGALLVLAKLDWKLDGDAWIAPDRWYPAHAFVRVAGKGKFEWITVEEKALRDAHDRTVKAEAEASSAVYNLREARAALAAAIQGETAARRRALELDAQVPQAAAHRDAQKPVLDAREDDLKSASRRVRDAQREVDCACGATTAPDVDQHVRLARERLACALSDERRARCARDEALAEYQRLTEEAGRVQADAAASRGEIESQRGRQVELSAKLPQLEAAIPAANANVAAKKAEETQAERAAIARKERQAREDAQRDARARKRA